MSGIVPTSGIYLTVLYLQQLFPTQIKSRRVETGRWRGKVADILIRRPFSAKSAAFDFRGLDSMYMVIKKGLNHTFCPHNDKGIGFLDKQPVNILTFGDKNTSSVQSSCPKPQWGLYRDRLRICHPLLSISGVEGGSQTRDFRSYSNQYNQNCIIFELGHEMLTIVPVPSASN